MAWPWTVGLGSFKVIENGGDRQTMYDFLLFRHSNYSCILYHPRDTPTYYKKSRNFYTPSVLIVPAGGDPVGISWKCLMLIKLEWLGYRMVKKNYDNMLSHFHLIPERHGQTDGQTDRQTELLYQYRASVCWRAIKTLFYITCQY